MKSILYMTHNGKMQTKFHDREVFLVSFTNKMKIFFIILYYFFKNYCATQAEYESKC